MRGVERALKAADVNKHKKACLAKALLCDHARQRDCGKQHGNRRKEQKQDVK